MGYICACVGGCKCPLLSLWLHVSSAWVNEFLWLEMPLSAARLCVCSCPGVMTRSKVVELNWASVPCICWSYAHGVTQLQLMVKHSQLMTCSKPIYFSLLSSSFLVPIVAAKWKRDEFFRLTTDSCSGTFITKSRSRRRLQGDADSILAEGQVV